MIIPLGHEQTTVRRLPWVSIAILGLNLAVFLAVGLGADSAGREAGRAFQEVIDYWIQRPYLSLPPAFVERMPPGQRRQLEEITEAMRSSLGRPDDAEAASEQRQLAALANRFLDSVRDHPFRRWGLIPAQFSVIALFTSMFMHAGWLHLIGNMFLFYLTGPFIEDAWGRPLFAAVYLGSGILAAVAHVAAFPDSTAPMVGASGAVAGLMGVFLIRFAKVRVKFFYWFFFIFFGTFTAPAWIMLVLWLGQQLLYASAGIELGVAYWAHIGGFACGTGAAVAMRRWQVEERVIHPSIESELGISQHPGLDEGMELLVRGELAAGRNALHEALSADPKNPDVHLALWQSFVQEGVPSAGLDHLDRVVDHHVRTNESDLALGYWRESVSFGGRGGSPAVRWRLATMLQEHDPDGARQVLEHLARDPGAGELAGKATGRLEALGWPVGEEVPVRSVEGAGAPTLGSNEPSQPDGSALERAPAALSPAEVEPHPTGIVGVAGQPVLPVFEDTCRRGAWEVEVCVPRVLEHDGLLLAGGSGGMEILPFSAISAMAVGGISGERRYLVLDLVVASGPSEPERVVRFLSHSFDPRALLERSDLAPLAAFRALLNHLITATGAPLVPASFDPVQGQFPLFADETSYQRIAWPLLVGALADP